MLRYLLVTAFDTLSIIFFPFPLYARGYLANLNSLSHCCGPKVNFFRSGFDFSDSYDYGYDLNYHERRKGKLFIKI